MVPSEWGVRRIAGANGFLIHYQEWTHLGTARFQKKLNGPRSKVDVWRTGSVS